MMLADVVTVARRFQRSIRLDTDLTGPAALEGYICHDSHRTALDTMACLITDSRQRAFTWTGPYGGGKSSLALALAALVSRDAAYRSRVFKQIGKPSGIREALSIEKKDWLVVPVVGRRSDPVDDIRSAVASAITKEPGRARTKRRQPDPTGRDIIDRLQDEARIRAGAGVLLIIDEMGKFLEGARTDAIDIHFFQELAEAANRCDGRLIVLGILHQSFEQYAGPLGRDIRDEWAKVQGRFVDIPIITAVDEVIDLIGHAIRVPKQRCDPGTSKIVAKTISKRRPGSPDDLAERLAACWPLHPVTAALLGPISRGQFAQHERSVFSFLGSAEPLGLQDFLQDTVVSTQHMYDPERLWDYLRANHEPAILASADGHRWAQGVDAIERCEARGTALHVRLAKTIVMIDLFRNGSGVMADEAILKTCGREAKPREINVALNDLAAWSVVVFRKHLDAFAVYAGSDFDIQSAVNESRARNPVLDFQKLGCLAQMAPLIAKGHYYTTGTLRWFETGLAALKDCQRLVASYTAAEGAAGKFILAIPSDEDIADICQTICTEASKQAGTYPVAVGFPQNAWLLCELGHELIALEDVQRNSPELESDAVARRELAARLSAASVRFDDELRTALGDAVWCIRGVRQHPKDERALAGLVSQLAGATFPNTPLIHSELVNRIRPTSNTQAAVRQLLYHMIDNPEQQYLGIEGFKAERGLYSTVLAASGLHGKYGKKYCFRPPHARRKQGKSYLPMWKSATQILKSSPEPVSVAALYDRWKNPPFGIKKGVLPVLAMAFILAQRNTIAVYVDDMFQPDLNDVVADKLLQDATQIKVRYVSVHRHKTHYLNELANLLGEQTGTIVCPDVLPVARALVRFAFLQPAWTRRTQSISETTQAVRRTLLLASDPHQTLFVDIPMIFDGIDTPKLIWKLGCALEEFGSAYPEMLAQLQRRMFKALGHNPDNDLGYLRQRAETVVGLTGDFRLDAFATRLRQFTGISTDMESIASLAVNKPPRDWSDRDPKRAALEIAEFALKFRHAEVLAGVKGRDPTRQALGIAFGTGEYGQTVMHSFDIGAADETEVEAIATVLMENLNGTVTDPHLALAALARVGSQLIEMGSTDDREHPQQEHVEP